MRHQVVAGVALLFAMAGRAQDAPAFDVTSVRILRNFQGSIPDGFSSAPKRSGGRISWVTNLPLLLRYAFNLPAWRIVGGDKDEAFYAVDATMSAEATSDQVRLMLQRLMAERFQLATHRETREVDGFQLVAAKNGARIKASKPGEDHPMPAYFAGKAPEAFEGQVFVSMEGKGISALTARGVSTAQIAGALSSTLGTVVQDETGLTGTFYFGLKFLNVRNSPADDVEGDSLFDALQNQLGLKLEKRKLPAEILVIDHIQPPSEN